METGRGDLKIPRFLCQEAVQKTTDEEGAFHERLRAIEQEGLMGLNGGRILMEEALPKLEIRAKKLGIWWMLKGALSLVQKAIRMIELTAEPVQMATIALRASHMIAHVGYEKVNKDPSGTYVLNSDLETMTDAIMADTCSYCQKKGADAKKCPLQKTLRSCTIASDTKEIDGCIFKPYSDAAYLGLLDEEEKEDTAI